MMLNASEENFGLEDVQSSDEKGSKSGDSVIL
jgi:hypothetical protein